MSRNINKDMNSDICAVCSEREHLHTVDSMKTLLIIRKNMKRDRLSRIILEEAVTLQWGDIVQMIKKMKALDNCLRNTLFWKISRLREMAEFVGNNVRGDTGPCEFVDFIERFFDREETEKDLDFLRWILESPSRCLRVFGSIRPNNV